MFAFSVELLHGRRCGDVEIGESYCTIVYAIDIMQKSPAHCAGDSLFFCCLAGVAFVVEAFFGSTPKLVEKLFSEQNGCI